MDPDELIRVFIHLTPAQRQEVLRLMAELIRRESPSASEDPR